MLKPERALRDGGAGSLAMTRPRRFLRFLVVLCALTTLWSVVLLLTGGFHVELGPIQISSRAPRLPLILAIVSGVAAWAMSMDGTARPVVRGTGLGRRIRFALLVCALSAGLNAVLMTSPAPPLDVNNCLFIRELEWGFRHILNCDSPEFLALAQTPSLILSPNHQTRQSRPGFAGLAYVVAAPLRLVPWITESDLYRPYAAEFVAYALINLAILAASLLWFAWLLESGDTGTPPGIELLFAMIVLGANDLTKLFLWSPHLQIFNLFVSCLTLYICFRLIERRQPLSVRQGAMLGLGIGAGFLVYGSFLIPIVSAAAVQAILFRRTLVAFVIGAAAFAPYACWVLFVRVTTGGFYSHEVEAYRQFVWIGDCIGLGVASCSPIVTANAWAFLNTAGPIVFPPLLAIGCCRIARYSLSPPLEPPGPGRAIGLTIAVALTVTAAFLALMGFYVPRLCWLLMPPLFLVLAFELKALRLSTRSPNGWRFKALLLSTATIYVLVLLARQGPVQVTKSRALVILCALASLWTTVLLMSGGFAAQIGSLRISSQSPRTPLVIALVSGLAAWGLALADARTDPQPRRGGWRVRVLLLALMTLGLNTLLLTAPAPPQNVNNCVFVRELGSGLRHLLNCDAIEFLALARTPSMVLSREHPARQSRPLSFGLPYLVSRPLYGIGWLVRSGPYAPYAPEFVGFALINLIVLVLTLLLFARLLQISGTGAPPGIELLLSLVVPERQRRHEAVFLVASCTAVQPVRPVPDAVHERAPDRARPAARHPARAAARRRPGCRAPRGTAHFRFPSSARARFS